MLSVAELNARFGLGGAVTFAPGNEGLTRARIASDGGSGEVYLHGAHVSGFTPRGQKPVLFLSPASVFADGKPIRGGVPVIFPWFGPLNGDRTRMHGLVRTVAWDVAATRGRADGVVEIALAQLTDRARLRFTVGIGSALEMSLEVTNVSGSPFTFEEALHTYFAIGDIRQISIHGLSGQRYRDRNQGPDERVDEAEAVTCAGRVDRVYRDSRGQCIIDDPALGRRILISRENSATTVVWNPWQSPASEFPDLAEGDWQRFVCVETGNARDNALTLAPGQRHVLTTRVEVA